MRTWIKAVLFDIDDTLFDRELAQRLTLELLVKKNPLLLGEIPRDKLLHAWALSDEMSTAEFQTGSFVRVARCRHFLKLLGLPLDQAEVLTEQYLDEYTSLDVPITGALELVRELKMNCIIGVVSNSLADVQYGKLRTLGLTGFLSCIVLSEEFGIRKPDPRIFQHAAELLKIQTSECLFVGDSFSADIVGAKAAGMLACWLKRHASPVPPTPQLRPDYVISSLTDLIPFLERDGLIIRN